jgi:hypothetical protein
MAVLPTGRIVHFNENAKHFFATFLPSSRCLTIHWQALKDDRLVLKHLHKTTARKLVGKRMQALHALWKSALV